MSFVPIDSLIECDGQVHDLATGALVDADSTPTWAVFQQGNLAAIYTGNMTKRSTGTYFMAGTGSVANGFTAGKMHQVKMTAIVGGITDTIVLCRFFCVPAWAVAGVPKVDVDDWKGATAPAMTGDAFARLGAPAGASVSADVADIQGRLPAALTANGNIKADTLRIGGTVQTAGDVVAAVTTVDDFVDTEIGTITTALNAVLALLDDARAEPGQGAPPVNPDAMTKLDYIYKSWRNLKTNDGTTTKLYADNGTTVDHKQTTSEAAGTVSKTEWVTGP